MVKLSICCRIRVATWALAPLFVTKMVVITTLILNQNGARNSKKPIVVAVDATNIRTMEKLRVKNGMLFTTNPTEHTGWIIVDAGLMNQAQISAVTMAWTVAPLLE